MASANDQDVERAMAALGGPSITYHSFRTEAAEPQLAPAEPVAPAAFPLLAAALPEAAEIPLPSGLRADIASVELTTPEITPPPPTMQVPTTPHVAKEAAPPPPPTAAPPTPVRQAEPATSWQRSTDRPHQRRDTVGTSLAAMFHILKSGSVRVEQSHEPKGGLQDLFRRL